MKCFLHIVFGILLGQRHSVDMLKTMFADCARRILKATESPCFAAAANSRPSSPLRRSREHLYHVGSRQSIVAARIFCRVVMHSIEINAAGFSTAGLFVQFRSRANSPSRDMGFFRAGTEPARSALHFPDPRLFAIASSLHLDSFDVLRGSILQLTFHVSFVV